MALSATLPLILVLYGAWQGGLQGVAPSTLYAVWSSAYNGGAGGFQPVYGQQYAQQGQQQGNGAYSTNPYFNAVNTAELSADVNPYDAAALQYSSSGAPMQTLHALASAKRLYHQMRAPSGSYNNAVSQPSWFSAARLCCASCVEKCCRLNPLRCACGPLRTARVANYVSLVGAGHPG
jgi:hypothetical protein